MMRRSAFLFSLILLAASLAACQNEEIAQEPTATLAPIVSLTPRFTATPVPSRTPTPTLTYTPSQSPVPPTPSDTPSPTVPPPILGVVQSLQNVNIRSGPGTAFSQITALEPGSGVEVLGVNPEGNWYNILMDDGREGWISSTLVYIQPSATPQATLPAAIGLNGTPLPTDIFGNTITPTPPRSVATPTLPGDAEALLTPATAQGIGLPTIDINAINLTATALRGGAGAVVPTQAPASTQAPVGGPTGGPLPAATTPAPAGNSSPAQAGEGIDVFALCNDPSFGLPAPAVAAGSSLDIYFAWFASTRQQVEDHVAAATYEIRLNGAPLSVGAPAFIRASSNGGFEAYWYVSSGQLTAGEYQISYRVTWSEPVFDGSTQFGPGTNHPEETGSCTVRVN
ncbi:MAG: SH3 domain-containing protein [Anaerolineae bacterium]|nr:SH3 domain-containing protein [Anaerolineae bacterium]